MMRNESGPRVLKNVPTRYSQHKRNPVGELLARKRSSIIIYITVIARFTCVYLIALADTLVK